MIKKFQAAYKSLIDTAILNKRKRENSVDFDLSLAEDAMFGDGGKKPQLKDYFEHMHLWKKESMGIVNYVVSR